METGKQTQKSSKICDRGLTKEEESKLRFLIKPRSTAEFAAKFFCSYSHAYQTLIIWMARGWVLRHTNPSFKYSKYFLNTDKVKL